jgi:hypothetical protein
MVLEEEEKEPEDALESLGSSCGITSCDSSPNIFMKFPVVPFCDIK